MAFMKLRKIQRVGEVSKKKTFKIDISNSCPLRSSEKDYLFTLYLDRATASVGPLTTMKLKQSMIDQTYPLTD